jgi:hypothetical protein
MTSRPALPRRPGGRSHAPSASDADPQLPLGRRRAQPMARAPDSFAHSSLRRANLQTEDESKRVVDSLQLIRIQASYRAPKTPRIDNSRLLDQDASGGAFDVDSWSKARRLGTSRGWRDEDGAQPQELIGLDDHSVSSTTLLSAPYSSWSGQAKDLAAHHVSRWLRALAPPSVRGWPSSPPDRHRQPQAVRPRRQSKSEPGASRPPLVERCARPRNRSAPRC